MEMAQDYRRWIRATLLVGLLLAQFACQTITGGGGEGAPPPADTALPATISLDTPVAPATDQAGQSEHPPTPWPVITNSDPGLACVGTFGFGIACIEHNEWVNYSRDRENLNSNLIYNATACPDGRIAVVHNNGISIYNGYLWQEFEGGWGYHSPEAIACGDDGELWVAHYRGASHFDGHSWTTYEAASELDKGQEVSDLVEDVAIAPSGDVWVITSNSIIVFQGRDRIVFREGQGFDKRYFFERVAFGPDGQAWVVAGRTLLMFDGREWHINSDGNFYTPEALAIDAYGGVWVGTFSQGLFVFEDERWKNYTTDNSNLNSNKIDDIQIDGQGRVWIATAWGLNIVDDGVWSVYRMDNTDIDDNGLRTVAVVGEGPASLPAREKAPGALQGQVVNRLGFTFDGLTVQACGERIYNNSSDRDPCANHAYVRVTRTTDEGEFRFEDLPPGYYTIVVQYKDEWLRLKNSNTASKQFLVTEGEEHHIGEFTLKPGG